jgi:alpha-mannosidase
MPDFNPYTIRDLDRALSLIEASVYTPVASLSIQAWRTTEPVPFSQRQSGQKLQLEVGASWGQLFDCAWFHFTGKVPPAAAGQPAVLLLDVNGEMLVVDSAGEPVRGLTNVTSHYDFSLGRPGKVVLPLVSPARGNEDVDVWADAGCNDLFGNWMENGTVRTACVAMCNEEMRQLYYDFEVLLDLFKSLPRHSARSEQVLTALQDAKRLFASDPSGASAARAREMLQPMLAQRGGDPSLEISAIGHAHMDLAWLWPLRETHRKGARTFATALANMERYPDYLFGASQPQLFQWMKEDYPGLYERIKARVADGRLEAQGAMWVEADTNLTGGESLVRQLLLGKQFFRQEFGVDPHYLWLPDVFGYSAALPQILKRSGVDIFMTQKLSWNQVNAFPHQSFHWQGIDGTRVLAHMLPEETYNSPGLPHSVLKAEQNYHDKGVSHSCLMLFGIGDGGGGPGEEHIERIQRVRNLAGLQPVTQEPAVTFFERWRKDADRFAAWSGELYLERHSGTLTTEARNKWYNRKVEQALRELEWTASLAVLYAGAEYPAQRLEIIWREVLLYQFHDILPGSSIKRVYDETVARYAILLAEIEDMIVRYQRCLAEKIDTSRANQPVILFNSLSWQRPAWVKLENGWKQVTLPPMGYSVVDAVGPGETGQDLSAERGRLENDQLRVLFAEDGSITSIFDKAANRELLPAGAAANRLAVYPDYGDAWDFQLDYASFEPHFMALDSSQAWIDGPQAVVQQVYRMGYSELTQEIRLRAGERQIEFRTHLHWRETRAMLRTSFPLDIQAAEAAYDIQFGSIRRSTHRNTTWDLARDETPAHKWADLSQEDYGAALLNDSKYGYKIKDNIIDLNLLRSVPYPGFPGEENVRADDLQPGEPHYRFTDQADHEFTYALLPHTGGVSAGRVVQAAYELNIPVRTLPAQPHDGSLPASQSFLSLQGKNAVIETVKQAEDGKGIIVRMYSTAQARAQVVLGSGMKPRSVMETNLIEELERELPMQEDGIILELGPFEIKTIRLEF